MTTQTHTYEGIFPPPSTNGVEVHAITSGQGLRVSETHGD